MNSYDWIETFKKVESLKCYPEDIISRRILNNVISISSFKYENHSEISELSNVSYVDIALPARILFGDINSFRCKSTCQWEHLSMCTEWHSFCKSSPHCQLRLNSKKEEKNKFVNWKFVYMYSLYHFKVSAVLGSVNIFSKC